MSATISSLIEDHGLDPIGLALGFGEQAYHRFTSPTGVGGLAKWRDDRLDLLAVDSVSQGCGQFREFIQRAKLDYKTICIWFIGAPHLQAALERYGFAPETEIDGHGEVLEGMRWDKTP